MYSHAACFPSKNQANTFQGILNKQDPVESAKLVASSV